MNIPIFVVDAFTTQAFRGNPAAVCLLQHELHDDLYQKIAAEMNLSETAFIWTLNSSDDFSSGVRFGLRWFTPKNEIPLCGHATIASAAVLFYHKKNVNPSVTFETLSGELYVRMHEEAIVMDFPQNKPTPQDPKEVKDLIKIAVGDLPVADVQHCGAIKALMVRLSDHCDRTALTSLQPDPEALLHAESSGRIKSIIVTMKGDPSSKPAYDFISRNFAPWHGIPEDPVTGSAHTILGSYWSEKLDKKKMLAYQCSSRGGELTLNLKDDGRVDIAGRAVTVLKGMLILPL
ncbi:phenazine biosynthesis-like domain-containing protein [Scleropages formosus]|uniref:Phenazine biosynthesis like protein domain containing n=1 Tax=Scleropages formosus TaxID=113540 RepID=A0A8C9SW12_SCLFO|nr:phenazine biosynthesis-like domain-containing protein [Scleropages formosus]XP_018605053.1 phenazine biosynthesis-like domain-containing protein [Scleropages formosus]XP_018605054.1 phenazine biosynthesis-like domain-containing protein [Scleropages formosus]XP_018605055.1 phenazine biosynthesis-like domain-containing protein [Scleropages formosus]